MGRGDQALGRASLNSHSKDALTASHYDHSNYLRELYLFCCPLAVRRARLLTVLLDFLLAGLAQLAVPFGYEGLGHFSAPFADHGPYG